MTTPHRHEWEVHERARACRCGVMQVRTRAGRWRNVTGEERQILACLMAGLLINRFMELLIGKRIA